MCVCNHLLFSLSLNLNEATSNDKDTSLLKYEKICGLHLYLSQNLFYIFFPVQHGRD